MLVLDASIIVKWFVEEPDSKIALQFKERLLSDKENIAIPDLLLYEVPNALRFKRSIDQGAINSILPSLFNLGLEIIAPHERLLKEAVHLSFVTDLSIYDCSYLALANELGVQLITGDKRIVRQAEPLASVRLLGD